MSNFKTYATGFLLTGLFVVCFVAWANGLSSSYGEENALDNEYMNFTEMQVIMDDTQDDSKVWQNASQQDTPSVATDTMFFSSLWDVLKLVWNSIISIYTVIGQGLSNVLGLPSYVFGVITAILTMSIIIFIWRLFKGTD